MADRKELIEKIARKTSLPKRSVAVYLSIVLEVMQLILARSGELKLPGFGSLKATDVPARKGVNPFTKENTNFAEGVRISFKPGKPLKGSVQKGRFLAKTRAAKKPKPATAKPAAGKPAAAKPAAGKAVAGKPVAGKAKLNVHKPAKH